ncbi:MAG: 50S ribosomal protein L18 [Candidatus Omnitrophica bacterium]|nr:50S ribosomal protein L18 [Candidatus Omnitrophota bacterium]
MKDKKEVLRLKRHKRIRVRINGTKVKPRLVLHRSLNNLYAQVIDDDSNRTLFSLSTQDKDIKKTTPSCGNVKTAEVFGQAFARRAKEKGITKVIFDRCGYIYHGRVKAFADACRKGGLEF